VIDGNVHILAADTIQRQLEFVRMPQGWAAVGSVVVMLALLYTVFALYRNELRGGAPIRIRMLLAALRCSVIGLLALIWVEPILATYIHRRIEATTLLLIDGSASMGIKDAYPNSADAERVEAILPEDVKKEELSRADIVQQILTRDNSELLRALAGRNAVYLYNFGEALIPLGRVTPEGTVRSDDTTESPTSASVVPVFNAAAPVTNVGQAVRQAIETHAGAPITAVVVFSDGQFNQGESVEVVARYARAKQVRIHLVGIGDPSPARNMAVTSIEAPPNVFVKDPFNVTVHLRSTGLENTTITVDLLERAEGSDEATVVDTRRTVVPPGGRIEPVVFKRTIGQAKRIRLIARVAQQDGETLVEDNSKQTSVRVLEQKMRVLLVAGGPTWEYRYLTRMLQRDETVDLSCWLQSADPEAVRDGNTVIEKFPVEQEDLFGYDCIILLDPAPLDIDPAWSAHVETMVSTNGSGLLYVAGRKNAQRFSHNANTRSLLDLLPVVIDTTEADLIINELGHFQTTAWPLTVPAETASHPVLAMAGQPNENVLVWSRLPGVYWHYPVRREKPVATVLLRHSNPRMRNAYGPHVLLATQFLGSGRTAFLGMDTTWRWRRLGKRYFNKFWIQLLRHMVEGKLLGDQKRGLIQTERDTYAVGEPVNIEARLLDARHLPMREAKVEGVLSVEGKSDRSIVLEAQPNRPGWYRGRFVVTDVGRHQVRIDLPGGNGSEPATVRSEFTVGQPDIEFRHTTMNREALKTLAVESANGQYFDIDEADQLSTVIPSKTMSIVLDGQPQTLWDRWWTLAALVVLLGVEWMIRKRVRLL